MAATDAGRLASSAAISGDSVRGKRPRYRSMDALPGAGRKPRPGMPSLEVTASLASRAWRPRETVRHRTDATQSKARRGRSGHLRFLESPPPLTPVNSGRAGGPDALTNSIARLLDYPRGIYVGITVECGSTPQGFVVGGVGRVDLCAARRSGERLRVGRCIRALARRRRLSGCWPHWPRRPGSGLRRALRRSRSRYRKVPGRPRARGKPAAFRCRN